MLQPAVLHLPTISGAPVQLVPGCPGYRAFAHATHMAAGQDTRQVEAHRSDVLRLRVQSAWRWARATMIQLTRHQVRVSHCKQTGTTSQEALRTL